MSTNLLNTDSPHNGDIPTDCSRTDLIEPLAKSTISTVTRKLILDIPTFLVYFAINLSSTVFQNQLLYQSCKVVFQYTDDECVPLLGVTAYNPKTTTIENVVQPYVARILMTRSLIDSLLPAFISLFIGPWTDKYGRRTAILISLSGLLVSTIVSCAIAGISLITLVNPYVYLVASVPYALCGGTCALLTVVYAYITDVAAKENIPARMFLNDAALGLGSVAGNLLGSHVFVVTNMCAIFGISAVASLIALIYAVVYAVDILPIARTTMKAKFKAFLQWRLLGDALACAFKRRSNLARSFVWAAMGSLVMVNFVTGGESNVFYLFVRKRFELSIDAYTTYNSIGMGIQVVSGFVGVVVLRKLFQLPIAIMALFALMCYLMQSVVRAAATQWWQMYLASGLGFLSGLTSPMLYAILTHLVNTTEIGEIFALTNSLTTIVPLVSSPVYTTVYNGTLHYYPGLFNVMSAALYLLCVLLMSCMCIRRKLWGFPTI